VADAAPDISNPASTVAQTASAVELTHLPPGRSPLIVMRVPATMGLDRVNAKMGWRTVV